MGYSAVSEEDRNALKAEVDRLIFPDPASAEIFLRQYVEPQLDISGCVNSEIWLLRSEDIFSHLRAALSIDWLKRFRELALSPLDSLFEIAAQHGNREDLKISLLRVAKILCRTGPVWLTVKILSQSVHSGYYVRGTF